MQLTLPPEPYTNNQRNIMVNMAISECADDNSEQFQTPNATLMRDEEFRTPLTELPPNSVLNLTAEALCVTQSLSPTYYSVASSSNSHSCSQLYESGTDSEGTADDSGLDENYHTPRVAKIKSMENLSLLEMEFHRASLELDRNSPRRLKVLSEMSQIPKIKSLNNLCADNYTQEQLLEEFSTIREQNSHIDDRCKTQKAHRSAGKKFAKHKVGNAKFIGGEETPDTKTAHHAHAFSAWRHYKQTTPVPIQKIRSMGTIPDVVGEERITTDPFLTPTSNRRPQFPLVTQSAEKATPSTYMQRLLNQDMVDGRSLQEFYTQDRLSRLITEPTITQISRSPFERAYKRSAIKSSTPLRQSCSMAPQQQQQQLQGQLGAETEINLLRAHSTNAAYDLMRCVCVNCA